MQQFDIIVIGDGVAARTILSALDANYSVLQLCQNKLYPRATLAAGALASTYGAREGLSALGDLNVHSYQLFKKFIAQMQLPLKSLPMQYYLSKSQRGAIAYENFKKRWDHKKHNESGDYIWVEDETFLVDPNHYLDLLNQKISAKVVQKTETVTSLKAFDQYHALAVIDCTGAYQDHFEKSQKTVFGAYYDIPYHYQSDFAWNINGTNILYHHQGQRLIIGATTQNDGSMCADINKMQEWSPGVDQLFKTFNMPHVLWDQAVLQVGLRGKGKKRLPSFCWQENHFLVKGLYKNGLMYSVAALRELQKKVKLHPRLQL